MNQPDDPASLTELLERLRANTEGQVQVSVGDVPTLLGLMVFGLAIVARDGLLALAAILATGGTAWFILNNLPW
jgi:hypothetical protein